MAIEIDPPHSQQGAIIDFKSNSDRCIACFFSIDSNSRLRVPQLIQAGTNRESDPLKCRWVGWFSECWCELFVFQHFFDLFLGKQPGARILHFGKERKFHYMKN